MLTTLLSCTRETVEAVDEAEETVRYVNVGIILRGASETKSVVSSDVENFHRALLLAYDSASGDILRYAENAGSLQGTPLIKTATASSFSWPLPMNTALRIYCVINPSESMVGAASSGQYSKESQLKSSMFTCANAGALAALESSSAGIPKTGTVDIGKDEFTEDNTSLFIEVRNLFAKFGLTVDTGGIPESAGFRMIKVKVFSANTSAPLFSEGFRQTDPSRLKDFDYATAADLQKLSRGGAQNGIVLYTLENCHGTRSGAGSWTTVRDDLGSWTDINLCTRLLVEYELNSKVYAREIFLGSGDLKSDFDVRRNMYKSIILRPGEETASNSPFFSFVNDIIYAHPGYVYSSPDGIRTNLQGNLSLTFQKADGTPVNYLFPDRSINGDSFEFRVSADAALGDYIVSGGIHEEFYWNTYGTSVAPVTDRVKLRLTEMQSLTLERKTAADDIYPYLPIRYESSEYFTSEKADAMIGSIRFTSLPDNIANAYTSIEKTEADPRGCKVSVTVYPAYAGQMGALTLKYGDEGKTCSTTPVEVLAPDILVWNESLGLDAGTPEGRICVDVTGTRAGSSWKLCKAGGGDILPSPVCGNLSFSAVKTDPYGTKLSVGAAFAVGSSVVVNFTVSGFSNLPGFDEDNYTFDGLALKVTGTFGYPGGYSVKKETEVYIENPLGNFSYDGKTYEYAVHQGRKQQDDYVSVSGSFNPDYMLSWNPRTFTVDLSRGRTRGCKGLEIWTNYSGIDNPDIFGNSAGLPSYSVRFTEDFSNWGPIYYGKKIENSFSHESVEFIHSIIRIYNHYNVFAKYDAQEKRTATPNWDDLGSYKWTSFNLLWYYLGCLNASTVNNFSMVPYGNILKTMISTSIGSSNRVQPVLTGYSWLTGSGAAGHGKYSTSAKNNYQLYNKYVGRQMNSYMLGYYENPSGESYSIYYDWLYLDGVDGNYLPIYWRLIAAYNKPWFKVSDGNFTSGAQYVTKVAKSRAGEYNFNIIPNDDKYLQNYYKDSSGNGYQYIHLFWEDKGEKTIINSKTLNSNTRFDADLCIVNGWYDPGLYENGIPVLNNQVGMYFYPENASSNRRAGYPAYYSEDRPYSLNDEVFNMEIGLEFGVLGSRDRNAAR